MAGLPVTMGDIGLVDLGEPGLAGALLSHQGRWHVKLHDGIFLLTCEPVTAFRIDTDEETLRLFLIEALRAPFVFGEWDCTMLTANWVRRVTGQDPASELRGRYTTEFGWKRLVRRYGGLQAVFERTATIAGLTRVV